MSQRTDDLLRMLMGAHAPLTSAELADGIGVSTRTVKREVKGLSDMLALHGASLASGNAGYRLVVDDEREFDEFRTRFLSKKKHATDEGESVRSIVRILLTSEYVTQDDIASALFVSRSTVGKLMRQVRDLLDERQIILSSRPHYGYYLIGQEKAIRNFMVECLLRDVDMRTYSDELVLDRCRSYPEFMSLAQRLLSQGGHDLADPRTQGIFKYMVVIGCRCVRHQSIDSVGGDAMVDASAVELAGKLARLIGDEFGCRVSAGEVEYLSLLVGNASGMGAGGGASLDATYFENVVDGCIQQVKAIYGRDFSDDEGLRRGLISHLYSTCSRMRIDAVLSLPVLSMVKAQYTEAYDYAVLCGHLLLERYGLQSNEDSLGYIAMHFAAAIERQNARNRFKVVVVCESGFGTSQLLQMRIVTRLPNVEVSAVLSTAQLKGYDLSDIVLVISTVPLDEKKIGAPCMIVTPFFDDKDSRRVSDYLQYFKDADRVKGLFSPGLFFPRIRVADKDGTLAAICERLIAAGVMRDEDREGFYRREEISSTEINPLVAMPHCLLGEGEKTSYAIFTTDSPVDWKHNDVQLIIVMLISPAGDVDRQLFPLIYRLTADERKVSELVKITDFGPFMDKLFHNLPTTIVR